MKLRTSNRSLPRTRLFGIGAILSFWMLFVDRTWSVYECTDCGNYKDIIAYRVAGMTVHRETASHKTAVERFAEDLGKPCNHLHSREHLKQRRWGLVWCCLPCINGIARISDDDWYDTGVSAAARAAGAADPRLGDKFYERVVLGHDKVFLRKLSASLVERH